MASYVLFNGAVFWLSPGVWSADLDDATRIPTEDAGKWVASVQSVDGFYPILIVGDTDH